MYVARLETTGFRCLDNFELEFGPGLNVLSGPNEFGKSTLLAALQALLFQAYSGLNKETRDLVPNSGGTPLIEVYAPGHVESQSLPSRLGSPSRTRKYSPGVVSAGNLTARHRMWGEFWAAHGFLALHVDSYSPRGHAQGFAKHTYNSRPASINEQTVRPLDAYGALDYLRNRDDVIKNRIGVQGWSNGAMTALATLAPAPPRVSPEMADRVRLARPTPENDFRAAMVQYPGCAAQDKQSDYKPYAPMLMLLAADDDEVSPAICNNLARAVQSRGGPLEVVTYPGAHHSYDDPGKIKQSHAPNAQALADTRVRAEAFFLKHLAQ